MSNRQVDHDDDDMGDVFRAMRAERQEQRAIRRSAGEVSIKALEKAGYRVKWLTDYQCRVNGALDLYPTRRRWHLLKDGRRGGYGAETALQVVQRLLT